MSYAELITKLTAAVDVAGNVILNIKAKNPASKTKSDGSPVTIADHAAQEILLTALNEVCPEIPVVSEENIDSHTLASCRQFFLVDPLDGTKEYLKANDSSAFTVNIGLIENNLPVMGIILAPALDKFYWGYTGGGAFMRFGRSVTPIKVREVPDSGAIALVSASHLDNATTNWLANNHIDQITHVGSSLKFALLAAGHADVYPRFAPTMEWDTAAGDAILRAAGGGVCHPNGQIYNYGKAGYRNTPFIAYGKFTN